MENVLLSTEVDLYVDLMKPYTIAEIGSKQWLEWHCRLQKLNQQATLDVSCLKEEVVKEALISRSKVDILVCEIITISIWKCKVLPLLLKMDPDPKCTFLLYAVLFHEASCIVLLESTLYHSDGCQALKDAAVDLIDYATNNVTQLFVTKSTESSEHIAHQRDNLQFDIGIRCISIIRYIAENLDQVDMIRLYTTHDVPLTLAQLLTAAPWSIADKVYMDGRWKERKGTNCVRVCQAETQCWLALRSLLLNPLCPQHYTFTSSATDALMKVMALMNDNLLDQISPLIDLKHYLSLVSVGVHKGGESATKKAFILEIIPLIQTRVLNENKKKWTEIAKLHAERLMLGKDKDIASLATELSKAYNVDTIEKLESQCTGRSGERQCRYCGKSAMHKCSRCKSSWYCDRNCQVKDWPHHKHNCTA